MRNLKKLGWMLLWLMLLSGCASKAVVCEAQAPISQPPANLMTTPSDLMPLLNGIIQPFALDSNPSARR